MAPAVKDRERELQPGASRRCTQSRLIICEEKEKDAERPYLTLSAVREGLQPASRACASEAPRASLLLELLLPRFLLIFLSYSAGGNAAEMQLSKFLGLLVTGMCWSTGSAWMHTQVSTLPLLLGHGAVPAPVRSPYRVRRAWGRRAPAVCLICVGGEKDRATRLVREKNLSCLWYFRRALPMWGGKR